MKQKLPTKVYLAKMNGFPEVKNYMTELFDKGRINFPQIKYLHDNLYKKESFYIAQNIFPVAMIIQTGMEIDKLEKLVEGLPDATGTTIFCKEGNEGYLYNKIFTDLYIIAATVDFYQKKGNTIDESIEKYKEIYKTTDLEDRGKMMTKLINGVTVDFDKIHEENKFHYLFHCDYIYKSSLTGRVFDFDTPSDAIKIASMNSQNVYRVKIHENGEIEKLDKIFNWHERADYLKEGEVSNVDIVKRLFEEQTRESIELAQTIIELKSDVFDNYLDDNIEIHEN
ncbi:hypothetical protein [Breznakia pachnodae]|uniref:Uncharacterized protein n=1 Tax=Breznakia pachnodae TaxID=265178 RepID=A0ABU0E443_9FIRM|nr:hypothetical protein [Breznakia pachnodae]MDQ0361575.1 hypothetical protein [Breznakia pachnodae]